MRVDLFDFDLPEALIALRPAQPRDAARLLVVGQDGATSRRHIFDLPLLLKPGDVLVVNDTEVLPVRLDGVRSPRAGTEGTGAKVELTLLGPIVGGRVRALAKPAKRLEANDRIVLGSDIVGAVEARERGEITLRFDGDDAALQAALMSQGKMPLPPYIASRRKPDGQDRVDYQTMFAARAGSIAAPTAGLHFTPALRSALNAAGIGLESLTLHVGRGTFASVEAEDTADHRMHAERAVLSTGLARRLNDARARGGRIVAVGTTALRTLESAVDDNGRMHAFDGETALFVTPGYRFKAVDVLMTNFHLPRSTLFMLVCAFSGLETMQAAYREAISEGYRFYSYGDASLLFRSAT